MTHPAQSALRAYTSLLESARQIDTTPASAELLPFAQQLYREAHRRGSLPIQGAWQLHSSMAMALSAARRQTPYAPPGGWSAMMSLLAGTTLFKATQSGFFPLLPEDTLELWTERELRRAMLESLSMYLIPPPTAAGLFLLIGLHPAWGLRVAHETHKLINRAVTLIDEDGQDRASQLIEDERVFPYPSYEVISRAIFACLSIILESLQSLEEGHTYQVEHLTQVVLEATRFARKRIFKHGRLPGRSLHPFIDQHTNHLQEPFSRALDFTTLDLIDHYLVPAGVVHRFPDQTFCVLPGGLDPKTSLFGIGQLGQNHWLTEMIAESSTRIAS